MNVVVNLEVARKALKLAGLSVATRATLPVLSNVKIEAEADGGTLAWTCTNLETATTVWTPATVADAGGTTVPLKTFADLLDAMQGGDVTLALNERTETLNVKCGRFDNNVRGIAASEFPLVPASFDGWTSMRIPAGDLRAWIGRGAYAAATDESRPILTGALWKVTGRQPADGGGAELVIATSDGFRLAVQSARLNGASGFSGDARVIVPARVLEQAVRVAGLAESDGDEVGVYIAPSKNQIAFVLNGGGNRAQVVGQLIDGNFPDYNQIIPKKRDTWATVGARELLKACKAAHVFARESNNIVKVEFFPAAEAEPGRLRVSAVSAETGDGVVDVDADVNGPPLLIAFNCNYLMDALSYLDAEQAVIEATTAASPARIAPAGEAGGNLAVVMPMNTASR